MCSELYIFFLLLYLDIVRQSVNIIKIIQYIMLGEYRTEWYTRILQVLPYTRKTSAVFKKQDVET